MAASSASDAVRALAEPAVAAAGLVVEDVSVTAAGRRRVLRLTVDLPEQQLGGVSLEAVAVASQAVSAALDASDVMGGAPYVLEVSSPGVDRPLTQRRHWSRARQRLVVAELAQGARAEGRLTEVDEDGVVIGDRRWAWGEVARGHVQVEFTAPPGADPQEHEGEDEL